MKKIIRKIVTIAIILIVVVAFVLTLLPSLFLTNNTHNRQVNIQEEQEISNPDENEEVIETN